MITQELKDKIILATEEAWLKGNVDALDEVFAPEVVMHLYPSLNIKGIDVAKQGVQAQLQAYSDMRWDIEETICEGDTIVVRYTLYMKHTGNSLTIPVPPTGKELSVRGCDVFHINGDKVVEMFGYRDYLGVMQQLGVIPTPGQ